jgi:hypothetical protein
MTSKLTVYVDDSIRQMLKNSAGTRSLSEIVNEALESYMSSGLIREMPVSGEKAAGFPSLSEVTRKRPSAKGSSVEIIASQRRGRNASLS